MNDETREAAERILLQFNACDCKNGFVEACYLCQGQYGHDQCAKRLEPCPDCLEAIAAALSSARAEGRAEGLREAAAFVRQYEERMIAERAFCPCPNEIAEGIDKLAAPSSVPTADDRLCCSVRDGRLVLSIGVNTLAFCWDHRPEVECAVEMLDGEKPEGVAEGWPFKVIAPTKFAAEVVRAILDEAEDGSSPATMFFDKMCAAAADDGAEGLDYGFDDSAAPSTVPPKEKTDGE